MRWTLFLVFLLALLGAANAQTPDCSDTSRWVGEIRYPVITATPIYYPPSYFLDADEGYLYFPPSSIGPSYYWSGFRFKDTLCTNGNFSCEFRFKTMTPSGIMAFDTEISIYTSLGDCYINLMGEEWGVPWTGIYLMDDTILSASSLLFIPTLDEWTNVRVDFIDNEIFYFVNDSMLYTAPFEGALCNINGFKMLSKGSGYWDWIKVRNEAGDVIYFEDFTSCEFATFPESCEMPEGTLSADYLYCGLDTLHLYANILSGEADYFYWWGPGGFESYEQNPYIISPTEAHAGTYSCVIGINSCTIAGDTLSIEVPFHDSVYHSVITVGVCIGESYDGYSEAGVYTDTFVTSHGCDSIRTLTLSIIPPVYSETTLTICNNEMPYSYLGMVIPVGTPSTIAYDTVTITSSAGCDSIITLHLDVRDTSFSHLDTIMCDGELLYVGSEVFSSVGSYTVTLTNAVGCDSIVHVELNHYNVRTLWDTTVSGCTQVSYEGVEYTESTVLRDTIKNDIGCDSLITAVYIWVHDISINTLRYTICEGSYYEYLGVRYQEDTTATFVFKNSSNCDSFVTFILTVNESPKVQLDLEIISSPSSVLCPGDSIRLIGSGGEYYAYFKNDYEYLGAGPYWDIGLVDSIYDFIVVGFNEYGCSDTASIMVRSEFCCAIRVPNAFSPNADGLNDNFGPVINGTPLEYRLDIFNRWGERVFKSEDLTQQWDGYHKGRKADLGVYFYIITGKCFDGTPFKVKGDITLIR